uniref:Uncharacterized protein n=1 Tax=Ixodes ricinus TaxID=34613 RepID=A0A6B0U0I5_IXORI
MRFSAIVVISQEAAAEQDSRARSCRARCESVKVRHLNTCLRLREGEETQKNLQHLHKTSSPLSQFGY